MTVQDSQQKDTSKDNEIEKEDWLEDFFSLSACKRELAVTGTS